MEVRGVRAVEVNNEKELATRSRLYKNGKVTEERNKKSNENNMRNENKLEH